MLFLNLLRYTGYMKHVYVIGGVCVGALSSVAYYYYIKHLQNKRIETIEMTTFDKEESTDDKQQDNNTDTEN